MSVLPTGIILLWSGSIATIPAGWLLCDGSLGTPDLRDRFLVGAGTLYNPDDTGGSLNHNHTFTSDGHVHTLPAGGTFAAGAVISDVTSSSTDSGTTDNASSLPTYYALAFIMKS